jgi:histidine triad (HIT) family protein
MSDCLFCKIDDGSIPSKKVYEDEHILAFHDIYPKAKTHFLVIPKKHIESLAQLSADDQALMGHMMTKIPELALAEGLGNGFRTIANTGPGGGQEVPHLHFHILGGGKLPGF